MKKYMYLVLFVFFGWSQVSTAQVANSSYKLMLKTLLSHTVPEVVVTDAPTPSENIYYLDAREKREYEVSHIQDAIWIGYDDFKGERIADIPKDSKVIVYCSVGYRSERISEKLLEMGFSDVSNLYGGLFEWMNEEKEVVTGEGTEQTPTNQVHAYNRIWGVWLDVDGERKVYK